MAMKEDQSAFEWMRTRPDCIKALMRKFPPACVIKIKPDHICECHQHLADEKLVVISYFEDGDIGLMAANGLCYYAAADHLTGVEILDYHDGQDEAWVATVLQSSEGESSNA